MYTLTARIFAIVADPKLSSKTGSTGIECREKIAKSAQNNAKTGDFEGNWADCYIMATMGPKLSVYVKINAAEYLFSRQRSRFKRLLKHTNLGP
ncbi:MAG: hypothetical protein E5V92_08330 [Mesorhizobium sp.]|uniref:hypothetical protein n=1 Tax=unclassified Mesorhizobium TaxID=325217 RepID=UPI000F7505CE|nr:MULTISPECIES: hypothetical protein [unclassified Mesorhizobium]AZO74959.1 hypothetical protein EJ067_30120 [Mesorhizobium sp. M1D.F.Ca.ET.043.01.1.1]RWA96172.1 MAG: hypothetical protein EOQ32_00755 [Mesorhizobium sp.]RWE07560.1 MAG: hypothetical protein EOS61_19165 [Mesorhizobium sp.]TJW87743.1 MAG: hypothetical protein E5V92_08330 [Mesorhizobium sp.]